MTQSLGVRVRKNVLGYGRPLSNYTIWLLVLLLLAGCAQNNNGGETSSFDKVERVGSIKQTTSLYSPVTIAQQSFNSGDFGNAEKNFRASVEENPKYADAWLGLAASYDRLGRFDSANRAYSIVIELIGYTAPVLNNLGYHYYLRGDHEKARKAFTAAQKKDPGNEFITNNIEMLRKADTVKEPRPVDVAR